LVVNSSERHSNAGALTRMALEHVMQLSWQQYQTRSRMVCPKIRSLVTGNSSWRSVVIITVIVVDVTYITSKDALARPFRAFSPRALFGEVQDCASKDVVSFSVSSLV